jgi:hypothetical protein
MSVNTPLQVDYDDTGKIKGVSSTVYNPDGSISEHEDMRALLNSDPEFSAKHPLLYNQIGSTLPNDPRNSWGYKAGKGIREFIYSPNSSVLGKIGDTGAIGGGALGAGAGLLAGIVGERLTGNTLIPLLTTAVGTAAGAGLGHHRNKLQKEASMFRDPRNFILEKLQGASDIGMADKARLAMEVRNMDVQRAEELKELVHAAMGYGVGSIVAKFIFGDDSRLGSLLGGMLGMSLARAMVQPVIMNTIQPNSYYDAI